MHNIIAIGKSRPRIVCGYSHRDNARVESFYTRWEFLLLSLLLLLFFNFPAKQNVILIVLYIFYFWCVLLVYPYVYTGTTGICYIKERLSIVKTLFGRVLDVFVYTVLMITRCTSDIHTSRSWFFFKRDDSNTTPSPPQRDSSLRDKRVGKRATAIVESKKLSREKFAIFINVTTKHLILRTITVCIRVQHGLFYKVEKHCGGGQYSVHMYTDQLHRRCVYSALLVGYYFKEKN